MSQLLESFLFKMMTVFIVSLCLFTTSNSLKTWIHNTNINNKLNWDKKDIPKDCDNIRFQARIEVATSWDLKKVTVAGLYLPEDGDIIFDHNVIIQFRNKEKCLHGRDLKYIRQQIKGWLDPDNWKFESEYQWLPHSERIPCAGESIIFPPQKTFAVQLPSILVPIGEIRFGDEVFRGDTWSDFLKTELGFQFFKGPDDIRNIPWRNGFDCSEKEECLCGRSSYSIHDGLYKETQTRVFEEAVCLYAMPKCKPSICYKPVVPEGHCCGICGDVIKLKNNNKKINVSIIRSKIEAELEKNDLERKLKTYVGRTKDKSIQIVIVADNPDDTIQSHTFANIIKKTLRDQNLQTVISSSGLRFSNYLFNSVSGAVFGTLIAVLLLFMSIYYIYLVLPKKKFQGSRIGNPFMFARFDNIVNEENLEIGFEPESPQELPQAFDNPMYSGKFEPERKSVETSSSDNLQHKESESSKTSEEATVAKEYVNPVYSELEKTEKLNEFSKHLEEDEEVFNEIVRDIL